MAIWPYHVCFTKSSRPTRPNDWLQPYFRSKLKWFVSHDMWQVLFESGKTAHRLGHKLNLTKWCQLNVLLLGFFQSFQLIFSLLSWHNVTLVCKWAVAEKLVSWHWLQYCFSGDDKYFHKYHYSPTFAYTYRKPSSFSYVQCATYSSQTKCVLCL